MFRIKRRSSAHSAYWMTNALIPAGFIVIYRNGFGFEGFLGVVFVGIGAIGYRIYRQKMSVPLVRQEGELLIYCPSDSKSSSIRMDDSARFRVHELGLAAENIGEADSLCEISRLDFDSNADWQVFLNYLEQGPGIVTAASG